MITGLRFGRYEALFRVAQGGMAEVFAARIRGEAGFERLVAVKRMLPHLAGDERFVNMFLDEARLAAPLSSPHVVSTLDLGRDDEGSPYIVLELVVGASLGALMTRARTRGAPISTPVALEILAQTALGLHHAHEACTPSGTPLAIVHRDVSPQNVLVGASGTVKVSDFGIAKAAMARLTHTAHGSIKGKIAYLSPEQANARELDRRSDVYALGVVAWEVLAGRRFRHATSDVELLAEVRRPSIAPRLSDLRADLPVSLVDAIARALAVEPRERWSTAGELGEALRAAIPRIDPTWAGPPALARWLRADPPAELSKLEARLREASGEESGTDPGTDPGAEATDVSRTEVLTEADPEPAGAPIELVEESTKMLPTPTAPAAARRRVGPWIAAGLLVSLGAVAALVAVFLASASPSDPMPTPEVAIAPEEVIAPAAVVEAPPDPAPEAIAEDPPPDEAQPEPIDPPAVGTPRPSAPRHRRRRERAEAPERRDRRAPLDLTAFDRSAAQR